MSLCNIVIIQGQRMVSERSVNGEEKIHTKLHNKIFLVESNMEKH